MSWIVEDRRRKIEQQGGPYLTDELRKRLADVYLPRFPTKRAVVLPALHEIQHAYGWIPVQAIEELATFLDLAPAEVIDTATFYEEYWLRPKGKYLVQVCRSLACELCDSKKLTAHCKRKLGIDLGETTPDGRFTLVELECLGACGTAPVALVNDVLHEELTAEKLDKIIDELQDDPNAYKDPVVTWDDGH
jgi:NADH-quinone oxidoreductase subunit E